MPTQSHASPPLTLHLFPLVKHLLGDLLAVAGEECVGRHAALELLELLLDLVALGLLLVELRLQFARHFVVALLCLLEVEAHLVDVCERVEVLVLVERAVALLVSAVVGVHVHEDDVLLQFPVLLLQAVLFAARLLDRNLQLALHLVLRGQVDDFVDRVFLLLEKAFLLARRLVKRLLRLRLTAVHALPLRNAALLNPPLLL